MRRERIQYGLLFFFFCFVRFTKECRLKVSLWIFVYGILASNRIPRLHRLYSVDESESIMLLPFDGNRFCTENVHQLWRWFLGGQRIIFRQEMCEMVHGTVGGFDEEKRKSSVVWTGKSHNVVLFTGEKCEHEIQLKWNLTWINCIN